MVAPLAIGLFAGAGVLLYDQLTPESGKATTKRQTFNPALGQIKIPAGNRTTGLVKTGKFVPATQKLNQKGLSAYGVSDGAMDRARSLALANEVKRRINQEINNLSAEAKAAGIAKLNEAYPGIDVKVTDSAEVIGEKVGRYGGGKAAEAGCTAMGLSDPGSLSICNKVGAMAGAFLGKKVGPYIRDAYNDVEAWVSDTASDVGSEIADAAGDAYNSIKFW